MIIKKDTVRKAPKFLEGEEKWYVIGLNAALAVFAYLIYVTVDYIQINNPTSQGLGHLGFTIVASLLISIIVGKLMVEIVKDSLEDISDYHQEHNTQHGIPGGLVLLVIVNLTIVGILIWKSTAGI